MITRAKFILIILLLIVAVASTSHCSSKVIKGPIRVATLAYAPVSINVHPLSRFSSKNSDSSFIIHVQLLDGDGFACRGLGKLVISIANNEGDKVESELFNLEDTKMNTALFDGVTRTYKIPWDKVPSNNKVVITATFENKFSDPIKSNTLIVERQNFNY